MGDKSDWEKRLDEFWNRLTESVTKDNGDRAILKRNAGTRIYDADGRSVSAFYRIYGGGVVSVDKEDRCFFAVCAECLWKPEDWKKAVPLVEGARRFLDVESKATFEKKLCGLLDLSWDDDGYLMGKIFRLLKFCQSKGIVVDGKELLKDLLLWNREDRSVQRKWAREFYRVDTLKKNGGKENAD